MLAVVKEKPGKGIEIKDIPKPDLADADSVLIKVGACGICGSDLHFYEWKEYIRNVITLPRVLGHEVAGIIVEVGSKVKGFKVGDRVVTETWGGCGQCYYCRLGLFNHCEYQKRMGQQSDGGMTNFVVVSSNSVYKIPETLSFPEAALIEPLGVALRAFERIRNFKPGDNVAILGPGPIGVLAALIAKAFGAHHIVLTGLERDQFRLKLARSLGIDAISINEVDPIQYIMEKTNGRGVEVVIDTSGGEDSLSFSLDIVKNGGEISIIGLSPVSKIDPNEIVHKEVAIYGSFRRLPQTWERAINLVSNKIIDVVPLISAKLPVSKAKEGFDKLLNGEALKVILIPD